MKAKGLLPKGVTIEDEPFALAAQAEHVAADVVDAVRWQDQKNDDLKELKTQDVNHENHWVDELIENFVAFDLSPSNTAAEASAILKELDKELEALDAAGYGPDARDYIARMKRELDLIIEQI